MKSERVARMTSQAVKRHRALVNGEVVLCSKSIHTIIESETDSLSQHDSDIDDKEPRNI